MLRTSYSFFDNLNPKPYMDGKFGYLEVDRKLNNFSRAGVAYVHGIVGMEGILKLGSDSVWMVKTKQPIEVFGH